MTRWQMTLTGLYLAALGLMFPVHFLEWTWGLADSRHLQVALMVAAMVAGGTAGLLAERTERGRHRK